MYIIGIWLRSKYDAFMDVIIAVPSKDEVTLYRLIWSDFKDTLFSGKDRGQ